MLETMDLLGNASSVHFEGQRARAVIEDARSLVASSLGVSDDEIIFTGSGTESDNLALRGRVWAAADELPGGTRPHLLTSAIEHQAVRRSARWLAAKGHAELGVIAPTPEGLVSAADVLAAIRPGQTALVSIQAVNNELGTLQPIDALAEGCLARGVTFHTDAVQALGRVPVRALTRAADLVTFSAHKVGGPAGVGVLVVRRGLKLQPALTGGEQESGLRPGTENVALIAAAARAIADAVADEPLRATHLRGLWARLEEGLLALPGARLNGHPTQRAPGFTNISFDGVDGSTLRVARRVGWGTGSATKIPIVCHERLTPRLPWAVRSMAGTVFTG